MNKPTLPSPQPVATPAVTDDLPRRLPFLSRRKFVNGSLLAVGTATLPACGGGDAVEEAPASTDGQLGIQSVRRSAAPAEAAVAVPDTATSKDLPGTPPGPVFTTLKVSTSQAGRFVYTATVLPLRGQVPAGAVLLSPDDPMLRSNVLSRWNDGSAAVVVASGVVNAQGAGETTLQIQAGSAASADTPLAAARIGRLVSSVRVELGALGTISFTDFSRPERIWWANGNALCARYRAKAPSHGTLEAVVDMHLLGDRVLVEVVVENAALDPAAPAKPVAASYTASVSVNGTAVATTASSGAPEGNHAAFRAWYAAHWVGGNPGVRAMQSHVDLQKHPLLFKCDRGGGSMAAYAGDAYTPWGAGRHRGGNMGNGGDHPSIGPLPQWEAQLLQTGAAEAARAVEASALSVLGFNVNYRDVASGLVPSFAQVAGRTMQSNWPVTYGPGDAMTWKVSHHPAVGLMAFVSRPSPVFIELAQKVALWNGTWSTWGGTPTGVFGRAYQMRGKAWCLRSLAHALFLTPDTLPWRAAAADSLAANVNHLDLYRQDARGKLNSTWESLPTMPETTFTWITGFSVPLWQHHYLVTELHKLASAPMLAAAAQSTANALADWAALQPVRWVNEQPNGGWRYVPYGSVIGRNATSIDSLPTWGEQQAWWMNGAVPPSLAGPWMATETVSTTAYTAFGANGVAGAYYPSYLWAALVAAVDRQLPGAAQAWATVQANVTNLDAWRAGFGSDPRWGSTPRSQGAPAITPIGGGGGGLNGDAWTPERDASGNVTQTSWNSVPRDRWVTVVGTRLAGLDAAVKAAVPGWRDYGVEAWDGVTDAWNGFAIDTAGSRMWLLGGGHAASSNNGLYRFDALKMAWAIESMPSDPTSWSTRYKSSPNGAPPNNGFTWNQEAADQTIARQTAGTWNFINDWYYDELPGDRQPTARHTYSSMVFVPESNEVVMICRRLWRFSLTDKRWTYKRMIRDTGELYMDGENVVAIYDEANRELLASSAGSSGVSRATGYALTQNTWTNWVSPWNIYAGVADVRVGRRVAAVQAPTAPGGGYGGNPGRYWEYDLDTRSTVRSGQLQFADGLALSDFAPANWFYDGAALTYLPSRNRYWLYTLMADSKMALLELDPTTTPWTARRLGAMPGAMPAPGKNLERKLVFLPALNAVLLCDKASRDMFLYRL